MAFARLFDEDPELLNRIDGLVAAQIRAQHVTIPEIAAPIGPWEVAPDTESKAIMGFIVLEGILVRSTEVLGRATSELLGPGDIVGCRQALPPSSIVQTTTARAVTPVRLGVLDAEFAELVSSQPALLREIWTRVKRRNSSALLRLAVARMPRASDRLLVVLWDLADRWGNLTDGHVEVEVPLTQRELGELISTSREAVAKSALPHLEETGRVQRLSANPHCYLLSLPAPDVLSISVNGSFA